MDLIKSFLAHLKHTLNDSTQAASHFADYFKPVVFSKRAFIAGFCGVIIHTPVGLIGGALSELENQADLTPETLLKSFAGYDYELGEQVQDAETFLQRKRGDCDDFASLAETILTKRGYHAKLVVVMMARETHVVCYVKEAGGFLDFNFRSSAKPVIESDGTLEDIAAKVAGYFKSKWHMASEFKYQGKRTIFVESTFPFTAPTTTEVASLDSLPDVSKTPPTILGQIPIP